MMKKLIEATISGVIEEAQKTNKTAYRAPLFGYAAADDPLFLQLKAAARPCHLLPSDLLPEAASVVAFFLPFTKELVKNNRRHHYIAKSWAEAYIETNALISRCCEVLTSVLRNQGVKAAWQEPTYNFDPVNLCAKWSHKHVAYICGLGGFGLHRMLITPSGCAGRFGSLVTDLPLAPTGPGNFQPCLYLQDGRCLACAKKCPSGALTREGLDKQKCYAYLLEVNKFYNDLELADVCGKCAVWGPCAIIE